MAYATGQDLAIRFDVGTIGDLSQDCREEQDEYDAVNSPVVLKFLEEASGMVDVALQAGGMYDPAKLATLTGSNLEHLKRVVCTIAMSNLLKRRTSDALFEASKHLDEQASQYLKDLQNGKNVFGIPENKVASVIEHQHVSAAEINNLNLLPSRMGRFFPGTDSRTPRS
jgi:phage gp36-like protein